MALINCVECGTQISTQAEACPQCGHPVTKPVKELKKKSGSDITYVIASWFWGILFAIGSLGFFSRSIPAGLAMLLIACICLPPIRNFVHSKTNISLNKQSRIVAVIALFIIAAFLNSGSYEKEQAAKQKEAQVALAKSTAIKNQKKLDEFNANKEEILRKASNASKLDDYKTVIDIHNKYKLVKNEELAALYKIAKKQSLLAKVKTIPSSNLEKNAAIYKKLMALDPDLKYKNKYSYYKTEINKRAAKKKTAAAREERIKQSFSPWDGSHHGLEKRIKASMHNPDSYDHVKTVYWDMKDHLVVRTTYRGTNGFGAVVTNSNKAKVSLDGVVLAIIE